MKPTWFTATMTMLLAGVLATGAPAPAHAEEDEQLTQRVAADERIIRGEKKTFDSGHLDFGPRLVDGKWQLLMRDDSVSPAVWRDPADVVVRVSDKARLPAPTGEQYSFLQLTAGSSVHAVPQTQRPGVVWLGWNTQDPGVVAELERGANLRLLGVNGPGAMHAFIQDGAFGKPLPLWDSRKSGPQDIWAETNTHIHANWVFARPGAYAVALQWRGKTTSQQSRTAQAVVRFAVGDGVTDAQARAAAQPSFDEKLAAPGDDAAARTKPEEHAADTTGVVPLAVGAGALTLAAAGAGIGATRRARRLRAEAESR